MRLNLVLGVLVFSVLCSINGAHAVSDSKTLPTLPRMENTSDAFETDRMELELGGRGEIIRVLARSCESCPMESFSVSAQTSYKLNGAPITSQQAISQSGSAGVIVFELRTRIALKVSYFPMRSD